MSSERFIPYEKDIKHYILDNPDLFKKDLGKFGNSSIVFEKRLTYSKQKQAKKTRADCLVFTETKGIIGIEIKTERDSTVRLKRQLRSYLLNCNHVYVLCEDNQVAKVETILHADKIFSCVGIIAYSTFKGKVIGGLYKSATYNTYFSPYLALNILHKQEVVDILSGFDRPEEFLNRELDWNIPKGDYRPTSYGGRMTKPQLINNLRKRVGDAEAINIMCDVFINNRIDKTRTLKLKHFNYKEDT